MLKTFIRYIIYFNIYFILYNEIYIKNNSMYIYYIDFPFVLIISLLESYFIIFS